MKKVNFSSVYNYKTGEFIECLSNVSEVYVNANTLPEKLKVRSEEMSVAISALNKVFNQSSEEVNTVELAGIDKQRLSVVQSMSYFARAMQKRTDPEKARMGTLLFKVLDHNCHRIVIESYAQKTALINAFLKDINESPEMTEVIEKLELVDQIIELRDLNNDFAKGFTFSAVTKKDSPKTAAKRLVVRKIFIQLLKETEAFAVTSDDTAVFEDLLKSVDKLLQKYNKPVMLRRSIRKKNKTNSFPVPKDVNTDSMKK